MGTELPDARLPWEPLVPWKFPNWKLGFLMGEFEKHKKELIPSLRRKRVSNCLTPSTSSELTKPRLPFLAVMTTRHHPDLQRHDVSLLAPGID